MRRRLSALRLMCPEMTPDVASWFQAIDATWPAAEMRQAGIWTLRRGEGGGQRVSAASTTAKASAQDVEHAAQHMRDMGQRPLFMVQGDQPELDHLLAGLGYRHKDPVDLLMMRCADGAAYDQGKLQVIFAQEPLAIQAEIWVAGGIDQPRLNVMRRVTGPKTCLLGRYDNHPVAAGFLACHRDIAMVHAVEVLPSARRLGVAEAMMRGAAWWALQKGAVRFSCLATSENTPAQRLYRKMGMETVTRYHYRVLDSQSQR